MDPATVMKVSAFVCAGAASLARPSTTITPQGTGSKDSAAMEETCDWRTHSQLGHAATESGMRQSKGIHSQSVAAVRGGASPAPPPPAVLFEFLYTLRTYICSVHWPFDTAATSVCIYTILKGSITA
jgi:hypothetical protein